MTRKGHFTDTGKQATVGAVMVGQQQAVAVQFLDHGKEGLHRPRIIQIRGMMPHLFVDLRQRRPGQPVPALAQIDQNQVGITLLGAQLGCQGAAHIQYRCKTGDNQRQGRGHRALLTVLVPDGLHRHGILAHGDGDPQCRTQLLADRPDGVIQQRIFSGVPGRGHPVGGQADLAEALDTAGRQVGDDLPNGHTARGRSLYQSQRRAFTNGHGLTGVAGIIRGGDGDIGHRHLPRTHHLVPGHQTGHRAVPDGDEKGLAGDGR